LKDFARSVLYFGRLTNFDVKYRNLCRNAHGGIGMSATRVPTTLKTIKMPLLLLGRVEVPGFAGPTTGSKEATGSDGPGARPRVRV